MLGTTIVGCILGFVVGTVVLWLCSLTTNSPRANIKTSAIYNAIMTLFGELLFGVALICLRSGSEFTGWVLVLSTLVTLIVSFVFLMRLYEISFLATVWLTAAMYLVNKLVEMIF